MWLSVTRIIEKSSFSKEDDLQEYVHQYPEAIPIYDIEENKRLLVVAREFDTASGPIDAFAVDNDGDIYVIETKLYKNPDKRKVVAQVLDYGASLWKHFTDFADFSALLDRHAQSNWTVNFREKAKEYFDLNDDDLEAMIGHMRENLRAGDLKFVVLMDSIDERLKDLITYLNQKSQFDIYGVEVERYIYEDSTIVIPKIFGVEIKKDSPLPTGNVMTEEDYREQIRARNPIYAQAIDDLFAQLNALGLSVKMFPSAISYRVNVDGDLIQLLSFTTTNIWFSLPIRAARALGESGLAECRQAINRVGTFYRQEDLNNPSKSSLAPRYDILKDHSPADFAAAVKVVADKVTDAMTAGQ